MIILVFFVGVVAGWIVNVLSERLPRLTGHVDSAAAPPKHLAIPAAVQLARPSHACRDVRQSDMIAALVVELISAVFLACLWQIYGASQEFGLYCLIYLYLLLIAIIDWKHRVVLNVTTYPAIVLVLAVHIATADQPVSRILVGGGMAFAIFFLTAWLKPGQLGFGDVKLATLIGTGLGFPVILWALIVGTGVAGIVTLWLLVVKNASLKTRLPYAPFLCLGAMVALFYTPLFMTL